MKVNNRKCIRRLSSRSLRSFRRRNTIAIVAIALTALLFTSLFTVAMSIISTYETCDFWRAGGYNHGTFKDVTREQADAIAAHPNVKAVGRRSVIGISTQGVFSKVHAEVSYMDGNCTQWSYAMPAAGRMPQSGKEIAMDTAALGLLGVEPEPGAQVTLSWTVGDKNQDGEERTDTFTLVGWWEYRDISPVHYINISEEYADQVEAECLAAGMAPFRDDLNVMMKSVINIRGQMEQVDLDLGYDWESYGEENSVRIGVNWGYQTARLSESMDASTVLAIAAFLSLVIFTGYLIIYNIFQISVTGDIRFYGLLKTIGVTPRQIRQIIRRQALLLCIVGIPAGLLLGYGVGALLTPIIIARSSLSTEASTISASPFIFLASALFALLTVLLSCSRPGRIAASVSPVEAAKYTDVMQKHPKGHRRSAARGAGVRQMAWANLGRNRSKTVLVAVSLSLSLVLLNVLVTFVSGFDSEKYLSAQTCADFIVSGTGYFNIDRNCDDYIPPDIMDEIRANTSRKLEGCGYKLSGSVLSWMDTESWKMMRAGHFSSQANEAGLKQMPRRGEFIGEFPMIEGMDESLFEKLTVTEGDISPLLEKDSKAIAVALQTDDYGQPIGREFYPGLGATQTITYVEDGYYIDSRTGEMSKDDTPVEFLEYRIARSHDVDYTICAFVTVPGSISYRYNIVGSYRFVIPAEKLKADSRQELIPMFYLFDTPDIQAEEAAESFIADLTADDLSGLMYESKAIIRENFASFQNMFLILGGLLCAIIGLVGVLNFFNAIMTGILSRKREFAVLQSIGMTNRQLRTMLICEGLFYSLGSAAAALALSVLTGPLLGNLLENMFWFYSARFNILPVLIAIPVFALLGWLIPSVMYGQTARLSVVERLRETE